MRTPVPVFRADSVVLAISVEKDGICGWSTPGSDAGKVVLLGDMLTLQWRGPTPPLHVTLGVNGGLYVSEPPAGGDRYTSRTALLRRCERGADWAPLRPATTGKPC